MEGRKDDSEKNRLDLLTFAAIEEIGRVLTFGAKKYDDDNWKKVPNLRRRYLAAGLRHVFAWARGQRNDPETGFHHLAHGACCFLFVLETELGEDTTNPATWGREPLVTVLAPRQEFVQALAKAIDEAIDDVPRSGAV
jgi:hypothetical protein